MPDPFDLSDAPSRPSRYAAYRGPGWVSHFTSTFAAILLAGVLLILAVRYWLHWSAEQWGKEVQKAIAAEVEKKR